MAIETVLHYYAYRPFPGGLENIALVVAKNIQARLVLSCANNLFP